VLFCYRPFEILLVEEKPHDAKVGLLRVAKDVFESDQVDRDLGAQVKAAEVSPDPILI